MGMNTIIHGHDSNDKPEAIKVNDNSLHVFSSATTCTAVTPADATVLDFNALYIGTSSSASVVIRDLAGTTVTFANVIQGTILPVAGDRVMAATGATDIVALKW